MVYIVRKPEDLESDRLALMDLEGTLTAVKRRIPENSDNDELLKVLEGETLEEAQEIGYWSGLNFLGGERPEEYFERVEDWKSGNSSFEQFEAKNVELWNSFLEESDFKTAKDLVGWYNKKFLNLRLDADKLVNYCKEQGLETGIITHTSTSLALEAAVELDADFVVETWSFNFEGDKFDFTEYKDYALDKNKLIEEIEDQQEFVAFFVNGKNDIEIADNADEAFIVENREELDYSEVDAFTGSFQQVIREARNMRVKGNEN